MIIKRAFLFALLAVTGLALQTSLFATATLAGSKPALMLLVTVAVAMGEGAAPGANAGFVLGLAHDLTGAEPAGLSALAYTVVGYAVGRIRAQVQTPTVWLPIAMVFGATAAGLGLYGGLALVLGVEVPGGWALARHAALGAVYNAVLTPFVFPVVRALGRRLRPARAVIE